jgi:hypothetical protein
MAPKKRPAARKSRKTTRKVTRSTTTRRPPRGRTWQARLATRFALLIARTAETRRETTRSRRDAAILRTTHAGCVKCRGTGTIATHGKDGRLTGSKPCPAKPATVQVSRVKVAAQARFGVDKSSGLMGCRCPCGWKEKPRYRDAKAATAAIRTHERKKHGSASIGAAWYQQLPETAKPAAQPKPAPKTTVPPATKTVPDSGMTDAQWIAQNTPLSPKAADRKGVCWCCGGNRALYSAFGGEQAVTSCNFCNGTGKPAATASNNAT